MSSTRDKGARKKRPQGSSQTGASTGGSGKPKSGEQNKTSQTLAEDRVLFALASLVGNDVNVTLKSGTHFTGVLYTAGLEKGFALAVKNARGSDGSKHETLLIEAADLVSFTVQAPPILSGGFATDSEIGTRSNRIVERELVAWVPDEDIASPLESLPGKMDKNWDQFEANKNLFNVETTWNEDLYTTPLNRNDPEFELKQRQAERIAAEIQNESSSNPHVAEERGQQQQVEVDEEDRYSSVKRNSKQQSPAKPKAKPKADSKSNRNEPKKNEPKPEEAKPAEEKVEVQAVETKPAEAKVEAKPVGTKKLNPNAKAYVPKSFVPVPPEPEPEPEPYIEPVYYMVPNYAAGYQPGQYYYYGYPMPGIQPGVPPIQPGIQPGVPPIQSGAPNHAAGYQPSQKRERPPKS